MSDTTLYRNVQNSYTVKFVRDHTPIHEFDKGPNEHWNLKHPKFRTIKIENGEEFFNSNLKNPLCSVEQSSFTIVVEKKENKVSFKAYWKFFGRKVGTPYFILKKNVKFLTVNTNNGNVYFGELLNYQNKRKFQKKIRSNYLINSSFKDFRMFLKLNIERFFDNMQCDIVDEACRIFFDNIDGGTKNLSFADRLLKYHLDKKMIKYPNNFSLYSECMVGNFRKKMKKMDNRIIDTFMVMNDLHGKKIKKILHTVENLNVVNYKCALKLFGQDWLNQDENLLGLIFNNKVTMDLSDDLIKRFKEFVTPKELKRAFLFYKSFNQDNEINEWTIRDHFHFYVQLKILGETQLEWKSVDNSNEFRDEHLDWSNKLEHYKKGTYKRCYPEFYYESIQEFVCNGKKYFPVLLSDSSEYNEESSIQNNCVKGYIGRVGSIIISLRKNDNKSQERLTVEYRIHFLKNSRLSSLDRVQTLGKYNMSPDFSWVEPLEILDKMMGKLSNKTNFPFYKLSKICNNGVKLESDTHFNEDGYLEWTHKSIDNSHSNFYYINIV